MAEMTECEWQLSDDPTAMLGWLAGRLLTSPRKVRLFVCGCCRLVWDHLRLPASSAAVVAAELHADRPPRWLGPTLPNLPGASLLHDALLALRSGDTAPLDRDVARAALWTHGRSVRIADCLEQVARLQPYLDASEQADVLRDLFGNPFRKIRRVGHRLRARVATWPSERRPEDILFVRDWLHWGGNIVQELARGIDEEHAFDQMPILADALEDAGCDDPAILDHCRFGGVHVRGCWVLDLILGRD